MNVFHRQVYVQSWKRMELRIQNLSKCYGNGVQALQDVSLNIGSGMFGLLGPNGAGKSTLMRIVATLQEADSGSVFLDEIDVLHDHDRVRQVLGYLPQEFGLYPKATALEMLDHFADLKGVANGRQRRRWWKRCCARPICGTPAISAWGPFRVA
jgi:ABC-2 type transport system ATP-binding protein